MIYAGAKNCKKHHWLKQHKEIEMKEQSEDVDIYQDDKEKTEKEIVDLLKKEYNTNNLIILEGNSENKLKQTNEILNNYKHEESIILQNACMKHKDNEYYINYKFLILEKEKITIIYILYKSLEKALGDYQTKQTLIPKVLYSYDILKSNINEPYSVNERAVYLEIDTFKIGEISKNSFNVKDIDKYLPLYDDVKDEQEPKPTYSRKCKKCEFRKYCGVPEVSIADLESTPNCWRVLDPIINDNETLSLHSLTEEQIKTLKPRQLARYKAWQNKQGKYGNKKMINAFLDKIKNGYISFDFETYSSMKPFDDRYKNYSQIPFSFSYDVVDCNDIVVEHLDYIVDYKEDNFDSLIEHLITKMPTDLPIVVYFKTFEIGRLKEFQELYPHYEFIIGQWIDNIVDLYELFDDGGYYDIKFNNSISLKNVYPVLCESNKYDNLDINHGDVAAAQYKQLFNSKKTSAKEAKKIMKDLIDYNCLDTLAQVEIIKKLKEIVK